MVYNVTCPHCGGTTLFDDTKASMFCTVCGKEMYNPSVPVSAPRQATNAPVYSAQPQYYDGPNLYINYSTSYPGYPLTVMIGTTQETRKCMNVESMAFRLQPGPHVIYLLIGGRKYSRNIMIPMSNAPVTIYASLDRCAHINIDQPGGYGMM